MATRRARFAARRVALGFTQESLASALGLEPRTIRRWEQGALSPQPWRRHKIAEVLELTLEELDELLTSPRSDDQLDEVVTLQRPAQAIMDPRLAQSGNATSEEPVDPMKRRTLIKFGLATTAVASVGTSPVGQVGVVDVERIRRTTTRLHNLDQQHGGETIWQAALASVQDAYRLLNQGTYGPEVEAQLLSATGRLQICAGWLCFDAGRHEEARNSYTEALALARQTTDPEIETRAWANLAFQSNLLDKPSDALRFAHAATTSAKSVPGSTRVAAIPQLRLAVSNSMTGDARAADRAITLARKALDDERTPPEAKWSAFLSPLEIDAVEATCAVRLGRAARAERLLDQAISGFDDQYARNRALYRVRLAWARLEGRVIDGAVEAADAALDDLSGELGSWRVSSELDAIVDQLTLHRGVAGVDTFLHRYESLSN